MRSARPHRFDDTDQLCSLLPAYKQHKPVVRVAVDYKSVPSGVDYMTLEMALHLSHLEQQSLGQNLQVGTCLSVQC